MELGIITILFLVLVVGWTMLPFLPSIREVRNPGDISPLPVSRESQVEIAHFADGFSERVERQFGELIEECKTKGVALRGELPDGPAYVIVPNEESPLELPADEREFCERVILSGGGLNLPPGFVHAAEIKAEGDVNGGEAGIYRAILAGGSLALADDSTSLRWLHAGKSLVAGSTCLLRGRVSAQESLRLAPGCRFERLQASVVEFGTEEDIAAAPSTPMERETAPEPIAPENVPRLKATSGGRWLVDRRFELAAGEFLDTDLVVRGKTVLRRGSIVRGNIKSRSEMIVEAGVHVTGSLVCEKELTLGEDSFVSGPVICEAKLTLQRGCQVGTADSPSTVTSASILVEPGARCHGTVWAHERGDVLVPEILATAHPRPEGAPA